MVQKDTGTPVFIAAMFTIARMWKQPRCPLTDERIKKMWSRDFPGGPVDKNLHLQCRALRFDPWSRN